MIQLTSFDGEITKIFLNQEDADAFLVEVHLPLATQILISSIINKSTEISSLIGDSKSYYLSKIMGLGYLSKVEWPEIQDILSSVTISPLFS